MSSQGDRVAEQLRALPSVDDLVGRPALADLVTSAGRRLVTDAAREAVAAERAALLREDAEGNATGNATNDATGVAKSAATSASTADPTSHATTDDASLEIHSSLEQAVRRRVDGWLAARPRPVINATGVILHTNLGRAPVSAAAAAAMARAAAGYSDLEFDLDTGRRGSRHDVLGDLLQRLSGAEASLVVNNNAGATLLVLAALARDRGVVVSRGQLVEIGGGYRIPEVMIAGGARLVEVGTTNRTHARDYEQAIDQDVALLMRVHASNFHMVGFTAEVALPDLVAIGRRHGLPVVDDLGSGTFIDTSAYGLRREPLVQDSVVAGADLVTFSGDKLLGGPQAGIIVGRAALVARLREHPLTRALRPDKATLAGLAETLRHYLRGDAATAIPVWRMFAAEPAALAERAEQWMRAISAGLGDAAPPMRLVDGLSAIGGGSLPAETLPTVLLAIENGQPDTLAAALRAAPRPVVARVADGALVLDPRTVAPDESPAADPVGASEDAALVAAVIGALA